MKAYACAILAIGATSAAAPISAASPADHDGRWAVQLVTDSGICGRSYSYMVAVDGGRVRYVPQDGDAPPSVSGQVSSAGSVDLAISKGGAKVDATGRLQGNAGSGSWKAAGLCAGRWTAQKRVAMQASR